MTKPDALKKLDNLKEGAKGLETTYSSIYFIFLSNLTDALKNIFSSLGQYFQTAGFVLSGALFLLNIIRFAVNPTKNAGEVGDLFLGAVQLTLLGLATFGAVTFGSVAVGIFFAVSTAVDMFINLVKSVYFAIRSGIELDPGQKTLYRDEASDASMKLVFTGIAVIIFILAIMGAAHIGLSVVATLSIVMGVFLALVGIAAIVKAVYKTFFENKNVTLDNPEKAEDLLPSSTLDSSGKTNELVVDLKENLKEEKKYSTYNELTAKLAPDSIPANVSTQEFTHQSSAAISEPSKPSFLSFFWHYYDNSMVKSKYSPNEILSSIDLQRKKLVSEIFQDASVTEEEAPHLEEEKRISKNLALIILEQFVKHIENEKIFSNGGTISFDLSEIGLYELDEDKNEGEMTAVKEFVYETPLDLKKQFNDYIVKEFPGVFRSFFYDVGKTEQLFAQAYQLLKDSRYVRPRPVDEAAEKVEKGGFSSPTQK